MLRRLPGFCLEALLVAAVAAGACVAKPPDLPDNPPIIVAPQSWPQYAPADPQVPIPAECFRSEHGGLVTIKMSRVSPEDAKNEAYLKCLTLHPMMQQGLNAAILFNAHPFVAFFPAEPPATCPCPRPTCQPAQPCPCPTRTVMENLESLEKAAELLEQAKKCAAEGRHTEALECVEKMRALVPGSSYEQRAEEVSKEVTKQVGFEAIKQAFAEASRGCLAGTFLHPGAGLCWMSQAQATLEQMGRQEQERRQAGWEYLTRTADHAAVYAFEVLDCAFCQATGCRLPCFINFYSADPSERMAALLQTSESLRALEQEWGRIAAMPQACGTPCYPVQMKMLTPVNARWTAVPLGDVLADLDRAHAVTVVVEPIVCLDQPVSLDVHGQPLGVVFDMLARPFGLQPVVQGDCVYLTQARCPAGEECCEGQGCTKACECPACPQCEKMHAKAVKKQQKKQGKSSKAGINEQVDGLMKACYLAFQEGRYGKATDLAREAHALDPRRVEGDPLVYKFGLLAEKPAAKGCQEDCSEPKAPCCPACPCKPSNNYPQKNGPQSHLSGPRDGQIFIVSGSQMRQAEAARQVPIYPGQVLSCPPRVQEANNGSLMFGLGVNSDCGLAGSVVLNERNFNVQAKKSLPAENAFRGAGQEMRCCPLCDLSCCGMKLADVCEVACEVLKEMYLAPAVPEDSGNNCLTLGLSSSGQVNAFCRTRHSGVVYNVLLKDGIFLMWMTPQAKAE
jgi:hypothetical protein